MKKIVAILLFLPLSIYAQIQITESDISAIFAVGNSAQLFLDTTTTTIDIGTPGGGNNWDFSGLNPVSGLQITLTMEDPAQTPYAGDFPGAEYAQHINATDGNATAENYNYLKLDANLLTLGSASTVDTLPLFVSKDTNNPPETFAVLPLTFNTNWTNNFVRTTVVELNGIPIITINTTVNADVNVDAYGTMTLPGGITVEALRIRTDQTELSDQGDYTRMISYQFIARNGAQIGFDVDTTQSNSGVVNVEGDILWLNGLITDVNDNRQVPTDYILKQNYPNPFNPSTTIEYSIPEESFVELKVYDILGNEVATLVNKEQPQGTYRITFNAENLPSGMYFAKLKANNYNKVIKMTLLK